jgi:hypothetical protein
MQDRTLPNLKTATCTWTIERNARTVMIAGFPRHCEEAQRRACLPKTRCGEP